MRQGNGDAGYPVHANGTVADAIAAVLKREGVEIVFGYPRNQILEAAARIDIRTVIVSCGTCLDQLEDYEFDKIFPGSRLLDIHEYLLEKGVKVEGASGMRYMYHDPCHTPIKTMAPVKLVNELMGGGVPKSERCCGESGTLAMTRPDISTQVRFSKEESLRRGVAAIAPEGDAAVVSGRSYR